MYIKITNISTYLIFGYSCLYFPDISRSSLPRRVLIISRDISVGSHQLSSEDDPRFLYLSDDRLYSSINCIAGPNYNTINNTLIIQYFIQLFTITSKKGNVIFQRLLAQYNVTVIFLY